MPGNQENFSEPDFDQFLQDSIKKTERKEFVDEKLEITSQNILLVLSECDALVISEGSSDFDMSKAVLSDMFVINNRDNLLAQYQNDNNLQFEITFEEYLDHETQNYLTVTSYAHTSIIGRTAVAIIASERTTDPLTLSIEKKKLISTFVSHGLIANNDAWFKALNIVIPGEDLNLDNPDDQKYIIDALETYSSQEALRKFNHEISLLLINTLSDAIEESSPAYENLNMLAETLAAQLPYHKLYPAEAEAAIDTAIRGAYAPVELAHAIKELARRYTVFVNTNL